MKKFLTLISIAFIALSLAACNQETAPQAAAPAQTAAPTPATTPAATPTTAKAEGITGKVLETMDAAGYTYVQVDNGTKKIWAAAPKFTAAVGDTVVVPAGIVMHDYHSKSLNRDFSEVYFVDSVLNASGDKQSAAATPATASATSQTPHPAPTVDPAAEKIDFSSIKKPEGGKTIQEIYTGKADLSGKEVTLRAKVVKFSPQIMGKNWLHIQDGTGDNGAGTQDLTVTSDVSAKVGDTVLVKGPITLDKDFGYGYKYKVIIEDAKVTVE